MVFSSPVFLFVFLPAVLLAALLAGGLDRLWARRQGPHTGLTIAHPVQNFVLLVFSIAFYIYGSGNDVVILLASILVSWLGALLIHHTRFRRTVLTLGIVGQLATLGWFKYANFVVGEVNNALVQQGDSAVTWKTVVLPIGISFFIFQGISYLIDVYRRDCAPRANLLEFALFKAFFPQLIAGPIVRYVHVEHGLDARKASLADIANGAVRFMFGLFKKLAVADSVAAVADAAFAIPNEQMTGATALVGGIAYTFQIYFDFSAYSDMAIGLGHVRLSLSRKLQPPLECDVDHRLLASVAHHVVDLVSRLSVRPARWLTTEPHHSQSPSTLVSTTLSRRTLPGETNAVTTTRSMPTATHLPDRRNILVVRDSFLSEHPGRASRGLDGGVQYLAPFFDRIMFVHWLTLAQQRGKLAPYVRGIDEVVVQLTQGNTYYLTGRKEQLIELAKMVAAGRGQIDDGADSPPARAMPKEKSSTPGGARVRTNTPP